jgi:hypothetical protein
MKLLRNKKLALFLFPFAGLRAFPAVHFPRGIPVRILQ